MDLPPKVTQRTVNGLSGFRNGGNSHVKEGASDEAPALDVGSMDASDGGRKVPESSLPKRAQGVVSRGEVELRTDTDLERMLAEESLPVLDAFHKFIDTERLRVRRTVLGLSGVFVVAMILVLSAAGLVGRAFFGDLRKDMEADRVVLVDTQAGVEAMKSTLSTTAKDAKDAMAAIEREREAARKRMAEVRSTVEETRRSIVGLGSRVTGMEMTGSFGIEDLESSFKMLTNQVETLFLENSSLRGEIQALNARYQRASVGKADVAAFPLGIFIDVVPSNTTHRVTWRLPDPS